MIFNRPRATKKKIYTVQVINSNKRTDTFVRCSVKVGGTSYSPSVGGYSASAEAESGTKVVVSIGGIYYGNGGDIRLNGNRVAYKSNSSKYKEISVTYTFTLSANAKIVFNYDNIKDYTADITMPA